MADLIYHNALAELGNGGLDFDTDTLKVILVTDSYTPDVDHAALTDVNTNELSEANGYLTGGDEVTGSVTDSDANDNVMYDITNPTWTAAGGSIGPCRYAILYSDTHATDAVIYCFDLTSNRTAEDGADFTITIDTDGLFTMAQA